MPHTTPFPRPPGSGVVSRRQGPSENRTGEGALRGDVSAFLGYERRGPGSGGGRANAAGACPRWTACVRDL